MINVTSWPLEATKAGWPSPQVRHLQRSPALLKVMSISPQTFALLASIIAIAGFLLYRALLPKPISVSQLRTVQEQLGITEVVVIGHSI